MRVRIGGSAALDLNSALYSDRLAHDFFDRGDAVLDFNQPGAAQGDHAVLDGLLLDVDGGAAGQDQLADVVVDRP